MSSPSTRTHLFFFPDIVGNESNDVRRVEVLTAGGGSDSGSLSLGGANGTFNTGV
jgi:hypothetical protein